MAAQDSTRAMVYGGGSAAAPVGMNPDLRKGVSERIPGWAYVGMNLDLRKGVSERIPGWV